MENTKTQNARLNDNFGNEICIKDNIIHLRIKEYGEYYRKIGTVNVEKHFLVIHRLRSQHLFRKANAYGFNYYILKNLQEVAGFDKVRLCDEYGIFLIPVNDILEKSTFLHFKKSGFERQIFMKISDIVKYRING